MHEVAHGLGFQNFVNESTGAPLAGQADVYMANTRDLDLDLQWDQLSNSQIVASAVNNGKVVWTGPAVSFNSGFVLGNFEGVRLTGDLVREINFGTASFGATPSAATLNGDVVLVNDGAGASTSDGCEAIVNDVVGKVALIDRGSCTFAIKAQNAQNAGAKSVLIANNATGAFSPGGTSATVTLATIGISREDGDAIKAVLPSPGVGVGVEYFVDPSRLAGATEGFVRLFAPPTVVTGSTLSHYDTVATPNLLMEPSITSSLRASRNLDLTPSLMKDIGWQMETLKIQTCDSLVANALPNGELMSVAVDACGANLSGDKTAAKQCINNYARAKETAGLISRNNLVTISRCAAKLR